MKLLKPRQGFPLLMGLLLFVFLTLLRSDIIPKSDSSQYLQQQMGGRSNRQAQIVITRKTRDGYLVATNQLHQRICPSGLYSCRYRVVSKGDNFPVLLQGFKIRLSAKKRCITRIIFIIEKITMHHLILKYGKFCPVEVFDNSLLDYGSQRLRSGPPSFQISQKTRLFFASLFCCKNDPSSLKSCHF